MLVILKNAQLPCLRSEASGWYPGVLIHALIEFSNGAVLDICPNCDVMMICVHLRHFSASELKGLEHYEQIDSHYPRFLAFLMTLIARILVFPVVYRSLRTYRHIFKSEECLCIIKWRSQTLHNLLRATVAETQRAVHWWDNKFFKHWKKTVAQIFYIWGGIFWRRQNWYWLII